MNLKKVLEEAAEQLESGKLTWTKHAYVQDAGGIDVGDIRADMLACGVCAVGACALVAVQLGELEPGCNAIDAMSDALDYALPREGGGLPSGLLITFNDKYALSAKSVADRLRTLAGKL